MNRLSDYCRDLITNLLISSDSAGTVCEPALTQSDQPTGLAHCLNNLGEVYRQQKDVEQALKYCEQALNLFEQAGDSIGIARTLNSIGCIYDTFDDFERALSYYNRSLALIENMPTSATNFAITINNIGLVYLYQDKLDQAKSYFERGLSLSEEASYKSYIATSCNHLGLVHYHQGNLEQAETMYKRALSLRKEIGNPADSAQTSHNLGELYHNKAMQLSWNESNKVDMGINPITTIPNFIYLNPLMLRRAVEQYENALHLYELSGKGYEPDIADELEILSLCYIFLDMQEKAISYSRRAKKIREMTKHIPHRVYTGKYSQRQPQITEEMLRKIASQIIHVGSHHTSATQKYKGQRKKGKHKRHW